MGWKCNEPIRVTYTYRCSVCGQEEVNRDFTMRCNLTYQMEHPAWHLPAGWLRLESGWVLCGKHRVVVQVFEVREGGSPQEQHLVVTRDGAVVPMGEFLEARQQGTRP